MEKMEKIAYGSLKPATYRPRIVDARLKRLLEIFGAVEVRGTKWCGKTWTSLAFGESVTRVDDSDVGPLVSASPALALDGARPHVVDEWQDVPAIWDAARRAVDDGSLKGAFILTGSSTPEKDKVSHSGAGRIARIDMSTTTLWERGESEGAVSLAGLFEGEFEPCRTRNAGLGDIAETICRGGWPAIEGEGADVAAETVRQYLDAMFEVSVPRKGGSPRTARRMARSLARNVATSATISTLAADAAESEGAPGAGASTVARYLELFKDLYFIEDLTGWDAPIRSKSRLRTKPKRFFADPSIPVVLLGASPSRLLSDAQLFGLLFESLCVHDIRAYASLLPGWHRDSLHYYHDADGLEADIVIELEGGEWAAVEVKLGEDKVPAAIASLERLRAKVAANPAARNPEPAFVAVVTACSSFARRDKESGAYVFPVTALRP